MFLFPAVCTIVFFRHNEYFTNKFWNTFHAYKDKQGYDEFWIMNIRFIFTYFIYHIILLCFSLFQTCPSIVPVAKIVHRGLHPVKYPFLVVFFFVTFAFPNESMMNF